MISTALIPAISAALELTNTVVQKSKEASDINRFVDRAKAVAELFDLEKREKAYQALYSEIQELCAKKGITPSIYYEGANCINIPLASLIQLMDAATS